MHSSAGDRAPDTINRSITETKMLPQRQCGGVYITVHLPEQRLCLAAVGGRKLSATRIVEHIGSLHVVPAIQVKLPKVGGGYPAVCLKFSTQILECHK